MMHQSKELCLMVQAGFECLTVKLAHEAVNQCVTLNMFLKGSFATHMALAAGD
jgi:hypothetical protein